MKRKFINFSDNELNTLANALGVYEKEGKDLLKQINEEKHKRELYREIYEEIQKPPKIYCC